MDSYECDNTMECLVTHLYLHLAAVLHIPPVGNHLHRVLTVLYPGCVPQKQPPGLIPLTTAQFLSINLYLNPSTQP